MTKHTLLALGALALAACGQQAPTTETAEAPTPEAPAMPTQAAMTDVQFIQAVANANEFEIQSSELAATRASLQQVKDFAAMMVRDHRAAAQELNTLAPSLNLTAPTPALDAMQQGKVDSLRAQSGEAFDDAYLDAQVEAHENTVRAFENYISGASAGPLRDWANATLPKLRTHLQNVQSLENAT
jgi:putative membrane protein